jgi:hypothetical protein
MTADDAVESIRRAAAALEADDRSKAYGREA